MNSAEYDRMYGLEDSYWWFVGRHHLVETVLDQYARGRKNLQILDIGCGTGAMSVKLTQWGKVISADFSPLALSYCRKRNITCLCAADACRLPFASQSFDLIVALDILEHISNDSTALQEFRRILRPGGKLIATVPAYRSLWSAHDVALMHFRRYTARELRERVSEVGLRVRRLSYTMTILFPIVWLVRRMTRTSDPKASLVPVPKIVNKLLTELMALENHVVRYVSLPIGVTVLCVAERE